MGDVAEELYRVASALTRWLHANACEDCEMKGLCDVCNDVDEALAAYGAVRPKEDDGNLSLLEAAVAYTEAGIYLQEASEGRQRMSRGGSAYERVAKGYRGQQHALGCLAQARRAYEALRVGGGQS